MPITLRKEQMFFLSRRSLCSQGVRYIIFGNGLAAYVDGISLGLKGLVFIKGKVSALDCFVKFLNIFVVSFLISSSQCYIIEVWECVILSHLGF